MLYYEILNFFWKKGLETITYQGRPMVLVIENLYGRDEKLASNRLFLANVSILDCLHLEIVI